MQLTKRKSELAGQMDIVYLELGFIMKTLVMFFL